MLSSFIALDADDALVNVLFAAVKCPSSGSSAFQTLLGTSAAQITFGPNAISGLNFGATESFTCRVPGKTDEIRAVKCIQDGTEIKLDGDFRCERKPQCAPLTNEKKFARTC